MALSGGKSGAKIPIKGIIFDYGNVLCHPQQPSDVEAMVEVSGIPFDRLQELYWQLRFPYDRGDMNGPEYWGMVAKQAGTTLTPAQVAELITLDVKSWARENDGTIGWIERLHGAGVPMALLSNMPHELSRSLSTEGSWARFFRHRVFSCDVRVNKPDPEIYQACLSALELPPQEVLFVDDIAANVEAAGRLGIHGLLFDSLPKVQARVAEKFDVPVPNLPEPAKTI